MLPKRRPNVVSYRLSPRRLIANSRQACSDCTWAQCGFIRGGAKRRPPHSYGQNRAFIQAAI